MNGLYKDPLEESYDDFIDDESVGTTAELINPFGLASSVGNAIGNLVGGGGRRRPVQVQNVRDHRSSSGPGVRDARLEVPGRGTANLRLPEEVVSKRAFDEVTQDLQDGIIKATARVNSIEQKDLPELKKELGVVLANTRQAVADEIKARKKAMVRQSRKLQSMQSTNLMMSLLFQRQLQSKLESHHHGTAATPGPVPLGSESEPAARGGGNDTLSLLPIMMMGGMDMGGGGSDKEGDNGDGYGQSGSDNNMMMMIMMMTLFNK